MILVCKREVFLCLLGVNNLDKFPEAFDRFEERGNVDDIASFRELLYAFASWAGQKWYGTRRQMEALADEAQRRGIAVYNERERNVRHYPSWISQPTWKRETITIKGKSQQRYRDLKTGRFVKKP